MNRLEELRAKAVEARRRWQWEALREIEAQISEEEARLRAAAASLPPTTDPAHPVAAKMMSQRKKRR
ncbi:MAG: hypothetical protein ACRD1X_17885 [Vicinamibacteria bacterium]